jgi:hypothetical protein
MSDCGDVDCRILVYDQVDDPIVADPNSEKARLRSSDWDGPVGARIVT